MNTKFERYVIEQLAATGFAVMSADVAFQLRRDIWATRMNAGADYSESNAKLREHLASLQRVQVMEVRFEDAPVWNIVATRSVDNLPRRIEHIVGIKVAGLRELADVEPAPIAQRVKPDDDPCPEHQCESRREWLSKRGLPDTKYPKLDRFASRSRVRF